MRRSQPVAIALCCGFALLYLASIRPSENWGGGDFALYMMHALNILAGRAYAATPFLFNPDNAIMSPASYPPGYPLLLAPVMAVFGPSVRAAAALSGIVMAASLWLLFRLARPGLGGRWALLLLLVAGLSPVLANHRDAVESDVPFLFWCLLALLCQREHRPWPLFLAVAIAPLTRTIGFVLPLALGAELLWQAHGGEWRPVRRRAAAILAGTCVALAAGWWLRADSGTYLGYFDRVSLAGVPAMLAGGAAAYLSAVVALFGLSFGRLANAALLLPLLAAIGWGFAGRLRRGLAAPEIFVVLYLAALLAFPVHAEPVRYALPILPLLLLYALEGLRAARLPLPLVLAGFIAFYVPFYAIHDPFARLPHALDSAASRAALAAIAREVPPDAVIIAANPRAVALLAGRHAVSWPEHATPTGFWASAALYHAGYLLVTAADPIPVDAMLGNRQLVRLFANSAFRLWRLVPRDGPGAAG